MAFILIPSKKLQAQSIFALLNNKNSIVSCITCAWSILFLNNR